MPKHNAIINFSFYILLNIYFENNFFLDTQLDNLLSSSVNEGGLKITLLLYN